MAEGDLIELNVASRRLQLQVDEATLSRRKQAWQPPTTRHLRGYPKLYIDHVLQADEGCDFDFLRPDSIAAINFVQRCDYFPSFFFFASILALIAAWGEAGAAISDAVTVGSVISEVSVGTK